MKIIFTFSGLPHYYNYVLNRLNKLPQTEVKVIIPDRKGNSLGKGVHESSADIEFGIIRLREESAWYGKPCFRDFVRTIRKEQPDIIVTIWPYILGFVLIPSWWWLSKTGKIRIIYKDIPFNIPEYNDALSYYRGQIDREEKTGRKSNWGLKQFVYYSLLRRIVKNYLKLADAHVYYTEEAYKIIPTYGVNPQRIFITYNSPDTDRLFETRSRIENAGISADPDNKIILHVGRLVEWKKVDRLIKAFVLVRERYPESELWIIGDGPQSGELRELAATTGSFEKIKFIGAVYDPEELGRYFMNSTVYVLAGMGGLSINEAMAFGKPVICSRADGTEKKLVRHGYNGYYFREDDVQDLAGKINGLFSDPEKIKSFGENSTGIIKNEVNINTVIEGYSKAFKFATQSSG